MLNLMPPFRGPGAFGLGVLIGYRGDEGMLVEIGNLGDDGVVPEPFEVIERARLGKEDMYHGVAIVDDYPLRVGVSVIVIWLDAGMFEQIFAYAVGHCGHMLRRCTLTDDKSLSCGALYIAEVYDSNLMTFAVAYALDDEGEQVCVVFSHALLCRNESASFCYVGDERMMNDAAVKYVQR